MASHGLGVARCAAHVVPLGARKRREYLTGTVVSHLKLKSGSPPAAISSARWMPSPSGRDPRSGLWPDPPPLLPLLFPSKPLGSYPSLLLQRRHFTLLEWTGSLECLTATSRVVLVGFFDQPSGLCLGPQSSANCCCFVATSCWSGLGCFVIHVPDLMPVIPTFSPLDLGSRSWPTNHHHHHHHRRHRPPHKSPTVKRDR